VGRNSDFPKEALRITARSGFITRKIFTTFLTSNRPVRSQLRAWSRLLESGYFVKHPDPRFHDVFLIDKKKCLALSDIIGSIVRPPYTGVIRHDEIVLSGVLNIENHGFLESWGLEQEFKSQGSGAVLLDSQGQVSKYPDAILNFKAPAAPIQVAVEIELSLKDKRRYQRIFNAYSFAKGLSLILFVCGEPAIEKVVKTCAQEYFLPPHGLELGFMEKADWLTNPILGTVKTSTNECSLGTWLDDKEKEQLNVD